MNRVVIMLWLIWLLAGGWASPQNHYNHLADQEEYLIAVKSLLEFDPTIEINDSIICVPYMSCDYVARVAEQLVDKGYVIRRYCDPKDEVVDLFVQKNSIDPRVNSRYNKEPIPRYCLVTDSLRTKIWLLDYLAAVPGRWYTYATCEIDTGRIKQTALAVADEIKRKVPLADLSTKESLPIWYRVTLSDKEHEFSTYLALQQLDLTGWKIEICYGDYGFVTGENYFTIEPNKLVELGKLRLDRLVSVTFYKDNDTSSDFSKISFDSLSYFGYDRFGNRVWAELRTWSNSLLPKVNFAPPFPLAWLNDEIEYSFDLKMLGTDLVLHSLLISPAIPKIKLDDSWQYSIYATPETFNRCDGEAIKQFLLGIADVETYFGLPLASKIKRVYISQEKEYNAGYYRVDANSVYIFAKMFDSAAESEGVNVRLVGRHEAIHALAHHYGLDDNDNLADLHRQLQGPGFRYSLWSTISKKSFFGQLNESDFDTTDQISRKSGGHAQTSASELVATFINSVIREGWEEIMSAKSSEFRKKYATSLQVFRNVLREITALEQTYIYALLEKRLDWLRQNE